MKPTTIATGILARDGEKPKEGAEALTLIEVAVWLHFGVPSEEGGGWRIPPRRFISDWFDAELPAIREKLTALMRLVVAGRLTREQALEQTGQWCVGRIQQRIADGVPPPNEPSTVRQKGSSKPLIRYGQLRGSISYEVREGGRGGGEGQ